MLRIDSGCDSAFLVAKHLAETLLRNPFVAYFQANTGCSSSATRVLRPASTSRN